MEVEETMLALKTAVHICPERMDAADAEAAAEAVVLRRCFCCTRKNKKKQEAAGAC